MGMSMNISSRLRNHVRHESRIDKQPINGKIYEEIKSTYQRIHDFHKKSANPDDINKLQFQNALKSLGNLAKLVDYNQRFI